MRTALALLALSAFLGLGLGEAAWGLSLQPHVFSWPDLGHASFLALGAALALFWALAQSALWRFSWGLHWLSGLRAGAASLSPCLLGFAWHLFQRPLLPYPHDMPLRSLQIFLAALLISAAFFALLFLLLRLAWTRGFQQLPLRSAALRLGGCLWIFFLVTGIWGWSWRNTGDQPHYLLMAQSLYRDHDLDLANDYADQSWRAFYDRDELQPQYPAHDGRVYTEHKPLLPLMAVPFFGALGALSGLWVSSLIAAATAGLLYWLLAGFGLARGAALMGFLLFSLNAACWTQAAAFYPDALAALLMLASSAALAGQLPWFLAPLGVAALAFANVRGYPPAAALMLLMLLKSRREPWRWLPGLALSGLSFAAALALNASQFGSSDPSAAYHSIHRGLSDMFPLREIPRQALGQWLDQEYGFLFWAPSLVFGLAGIIAWKRYPAFKPLAYGLPALAYYLPVAAYWDWTGVMAPCRYLVPLLPLLALAAAFAFEELQKKAWFWALLALTLLQGLGVAILPWLNFSKMDGKNLVLKALEAKTRLNLTGFFPSFMMWGWSGLIWALLMGALLFMITRNFRQPWRGRAGNRDLLDPRAVNPARPGREQR